MQDITLSLGVSKYFSKAVFTMAKLQRLELKHVKADKQFFAVMSDVAHKSNVLNFNLFTSIIL